MLEYLSKDEKIDVILADINMPELDLLSLLKELKALDLDARVVILSMNDNDAYIYIELLWKVHRDICLKVLVRMSLSLRLSISMVGAGTFARDFP
ncbi:transcriptional regulator NarL [compost metagenome]